MSLGSSYGMHNNLQRDGLVKDQCRVPEGRVHFRKPGEDAGLRPPGASGGGERFNNIFFDGTLLKEREPASPRR